MLLDTKSLWQSWSPTQSPRRSPFPQSLGPLDIRPIGDIPLVTEGVWTLVHSRAPLETLKRAALSTSCQDSVQGELEQLAFESLEWLSGAVSPRSPVTLPATARRRLYIPAVAVSYVWCYPSEVLAMWPDGALEAVIGDDVTADEQFLVNGGFAYLDADGECVAANAVSGHGRLLPFDPPVLCGAGDGGAAELWQRVTIPGLRAAGAQYYRWYVPGAKMGGGAALTHGGFGYIWRRPTEPPDPRDRYFAIRRAKSTSRQDDQWRSKHWKKLGKAHLRQLEKRRANRTLSRVWHLMCTGIRERKLYSIERTPDDMRVSLQQMWQYWEQKKLGVMDELLRNLVFPPQCNAWDALSAGAERAGGVAQLCLTLYTQEGPDTDRACGWPDVPGSKDKAAWGRYRASFQDQRVRNPLASAAVPGYVLGAVFRLVSWAGRVVFMRSATTARREMAAAETEMRRWVKFFAVIVAAAAELRPEAASLSLRECERRIAREGDEARARKFRQALGVAEAALDGRRAWRGIAGIPEGDLRRLQRLHPGACISWSAPASASLDQDVARGFATRAAASDMAQDTSQDLLSSAADPLQTEAVDGLFHAPAPTSPEASEHCPTAGAFAVMFHLHGVRVGAPLWQLSQYPEELEILMPPFVSFRVLRTPDDPEVSWSAGCALTMLHVHLEQVEWCGATAAPGMLDAIRADITAADLRLKKWQLKLAPLVDALRQSSAEARTRDAWELLHRWRERRKMLRRGFDLVLSVVVPAETVMTAAFLLWRGYLLRRLLRFATGTAGWRTRGGQR